MKQNQQNGGYALVLVGIGVAIIGIVAAIALTSPAAIQAPGNPPTSNQAEYLKTQTELEAEAEGLLAPIQDAKDARDAVEAATNARTGAESTTLSPPSGKPTERYVSYANAQLTNDTNIIFFYATWCPTCRALEKDLTNNLADIPADVTIYKADYDTEVALKQQYGVTRQHTLVLVDGNGNKIRTLTGLSNNLDQLLGQL